MTLLYDLDEICSNSYRDFHAKGFDYLCLHRSPALTLKAYFFEGECLEASELVVPHDHRYGFITHILAGRLSERRWVRAERPINSAVYQEFSYRTPLNGGDGFTWEREVRLARGTIREYAAGQFYMTPRTEIHTLSDISAGTAIVITQLADELPLDASTSAFRRGIGHEAPTTDGLYSRMDPDHAGRRLDQLRIMGWPA